MEIRRFDLRPMSNAEKMGGIRKAANSIDKRSVIHENPEAQKRLADIVFCRAVQSGHLPYELKIRFLDILEARYFHRIDRGKFAKTFFDPHDLISSSIAGHKAAADLRLNFMTQDLKHDFVGWGMTHYAEIRFERLDLFMRAWDGARIACEVEFGKRVEYFSEECKDRLYEIAADNFCSWLYGETKDPELDVTDERVKRANDAERDKSLNEAIEAYEKAKEAEMKKLFDDLQKDGI